MGLRFQEMMLLSEYIHQLPNRVFLSISVVLLDSSKYILAPTDLYMGIEV